MSTRRRPSHRLRLRIYPRWLRDEFGEHMMAYPARQEGEPRYRAGRLGTARFWWDAGTSALLTGVALRWGSLADRRPGADDLRRGLSARRPERATERHVDSGGGHSVLRRMGG